MVAAYIAEQVTGKPIGVLFAELLWKPLGMTSCSMGTAWARSASSQPAPHLWNGREPRVQPDGAGNSRVLDGADNSRCNASDLLRYANTHLQGEARGALGLSSAAWMQMHTAASGETYANGWIIVPHARWTKGTMYTHAGSNTMNYATIYLAPAINSAIVVLTNIGGSTNGSAVDDQTVAAEQEAARTIVEIVKGRS